MRFCISATMDPSSLSIYTKGKSEFRQFPPSFIIASVSLLMSFWVWQGSFFSSQPLLNPSPFHIEYKPPYPPASLPLWLPALVATCSKLSWNWAAILDQDLLGGCAQVSMWAVCTSRLLSCLNIDISLIPKREMIPLCYLWLFATYVPPVRRFSLVTK